MFDDIIKPKKKKKNEITEKHWMAGMTGFRMPKDKIDQAINRAIRKGKVDARIVDLLRK